MLLDLHPVLRGLSKRRCQKQGLESSLLVNYVENFFLFRSRPFCLLFLTAQTNALRDQYPRPIPRKPLLSDTSVLFHCLFQLPLPVSVPEPPMSRLVFV